MNFELLKYYQNVLGIQFLPKSLLNEPEPQATIPDVSLWRRDLISGPIDLTDLCCDLLFVSVISTAEDESLFQESSQSLFEKMKKAMSLEQIQIQTLEHVGSENTLFQDLLKIKTKMVVLMKANPERRGLQSCPQFKFLETHSPQVLSQNPALKKDTWDDLQQVMKSFKN